MTVRIWYEKYSGYNCYEGADCVDSMEEVPAAILELLKSEATSDQGVSITHIGNLEYDEVLALVDRVDHEYRNELRVLELQHTLSKLKAKADKIKREGLIIDTQISSTAHQIAILQEKMNNA